MSALRLTVADLTALRQRGILIEFPVQSVASVRVVQQPPGKRGPDRKKRKAKAAPRHFFAEHQPKRSRALARLKAECGLAS